MSSLRGAESSHNPDTAQSQTATNSPTPVCVVYPIRPPTNAENDNLQPRVHPMVEFLEDPEVQNIKAFCYLCLTNVVGTEALAHLYFGSLKCNNCAYVVSSCRDFVSRYPSKDKCRDNDKVHDITQWTVSVWSYLKYCAVRDLKISKFLNKGNAEISEKDVIVSYMERLLPLRDKAPWKFGFEEPEVSKVINDSPSTNRKRPSDNQEVHSSVEVSNMKIFRFQHNKAIDTPQKDKLPLSSVSPSTKTNVMQKKITSQQNIASQNVATPTQSGKIDKFVIQVQTCRLKGKNNNTSVTETSSHETPTASLQKSSAQQDRDSQQNVQVTNQTSQKKSRQKATSQQNTIVTNSSLIKTKGSSSINQQRKLEEGNQQSSQGVTQTSKVNQDTAAENASSLRRKMPTLQIMDHQEGRQNLSLWRKMPKLVSVNKEEEKQKSLQGKQNSSSTSTSSLQREMPTLQITTMQEGRGNEKNTQHKSPVTPSSEKRAENKQNTSMAGSSHSTEGFSFEEQKRQKRDNECTLQLAVHASESEHTRAQGTDKQNRSLVSSASCEAQTSSDWGSVQEKEDQQGIQDITSDDDNKSRLAPLIRKSNFCRMVARQSSAYKRKEILLKTPHSIKKEQIDPSCNRKKLQYNIDKHNFVPVTVASMARYLVVKYPLQNVPEECPDCYAPFNNQLLSVNLTTNNVNFICPDCKLPVYITFVSS